ncbi:hypothetical protein WDW37_15195 [Bdellovibrionota bacterium FG-1]
MANNSQSGATKAGENKLQEWLSSVSEWLGEQSWFQQLKGKWDELDPPSKSYLKAGGLGALTLSVILLVISSLWSIHSLKSELNEKQDLLSMIQSANEELRRLKETNGNVPSPAAGGGTWQNYFESLAAGVGIDKTSLTVGTEKPGPANEITKETLYDVSLKHVSIKQVVRYAHGLENGVRPVKLRNLQIDTKGDAEGYMDATLALSGFILVTK